MDDFISFSRLRTLLLEDGPKADEVREALGLRLRVTTLNYRVGEPGFTATVHRREQRSVVSEDIIEEHTFKPVGNG